MDELAKTCAQLQTLQRSRAWAIKARVLLENNRRANVASMLGYTSAEEDESARKKLFKDADSLIENILKADPTAHPIGGIVHAIELSVTSLVQQQRGFEKQMLPLVRETPAAAWVREPEQNGFGELSLAVVIGETGDLREYANPGKVWKRLGCAPFTSRGKTQMGATWKSKGGLSCEEWTAFGYSPRRRSIAYLIGESLLKKNTLRIAGGGEVDFVTEDAGALASSDTTGDGDLGCETDGRAAVPGPYRQRYLDARAHVEANRPEWTACVCAGTGKTARGGKCKSCKGRGRILLRCHRHGMLLATKLLLKNLWKVWNPHLVTAQPWDAPAGECVTVSE